MNIIQKSINYFNESLKDLLMFSPLKGSIISDDTC